MEYQYRVVPLLVAIKSGEQNPAAAITSQVQTLIDRHSGEGWEYYALESVPVTVRPGCLAGLFGAASQTIHYPCVVFRAGNSTETALGWLSNIDANTRRTADALAGAQVSRGQ